MSVRLSRAVLVTALLLSLVVLPAVPSSAAVETTVHYVPTRLPDGTEELIRVEVQRDTPKDLWSGLRVRSPPAT